MVPSTIWFKLILKGYISVIINYMVHVSRSIKANLQVEKWNDKITMSLAIQILSKI